MARRPERRGTGEGKHVGTTNGSNTRLGAGVNGAVPGDNSRDGVMAHDAKAGGDMPRDTISGGSTPRTKHGAAMALSDGNAPRATSASTASPRVLFPPTKTLTDSEYALVARRTRQRRETAEAEVVASAAERVRERCAKPTSATAATGIEEGTSSATKRSIARNTQRLKEADASDAAVIGELIPSGVRSFVDCENTFLSADAGSFFPVPLLGPDDSFAPPAWFLEAIRGIYHTTTKTPTKPPIIFEPGARAAAQNAELLRGFGYNLGSLIKAHSSTTLGFGSEFRTVEELRPLLGKHIHFGKLADLLTNGMDYVFTREVSESEREGEVIAMLSRGNHKSAQSEQDQVGVLIAKDVLHGFTIPIPVDTVQKIPGAMVQPLGLVQQWTVSPDGERVIKYRLTQDLSFSTDKKAAPTSINSRVDMGSYPEMVYGWCLPRILHYVTSLRIHYPSLLIFISKYDYSDAYRRIAHSAKAATQTVSVNGETAFVSLRLTFGGSPNPPTWCMFSELVTDLANEIAQCPEWDPVELRSPAQPETPEPIRLHSDIPIARGREMAVLVPRPTMGGKVDGFIDDLINVFVDTPENCARQPHVVPLAMHVTSRPHAGESEEPVPRRPILSLPKLIAEGRPEEVQTVLGWTINTRSLEIALPSDKYHAWLEDIRIVRQSGRCSYAALETLVGRLNHTAYVLPNARHFLSRIREGLGPPDRSRTTNRRSLKISADAADDLALWEEFLANAHAGISMNLLVTRTPTKVCWSDACPFGIGGYNLSGRAWRIQIPQSSPLAGHKGVNNLLEFVGMAINIWLSCLEDEGEQSCILAVGDNTSALGWLHNTSRLDPAWPAHTAHLQVARKIASLLMGFQCCLASQHIKGELNLVADLLSFSGKDRGKGHPLAFDDPANDELTARFLSTLPSQVPANFVISQLPDEILSWTAQVLLATELSLTEGRREATKYLTGPGGGGPATAGTSATTVTPTSLCYPSTSKSSSLGRSSTSIVLPNGTPMADLQALVRSQWSRVLCAKPQATWLRRFGGISGVAPCTSRGRPTCDPSCECG